MNHQPENMENALTGSQSSHASLRDIHSINPTQLMARIESYEGREKKGISDVRRTFCLFVTFDLLFVTLLWIIESNVNGGIEKTLEKKVMQYDYYSSYFDIFLLAAAHWWAIALTTAVTSAFLLAKVILSKLFSQGAFVLPQGAEENRLLIVQDASEREALIPGGLSDGLKTSSQREREREREREERERERERQRVLLCCSSSWTLLPPPPEWLAMHTLQVCATMPGFCIIIIMRLCLTLSLSLEFSDMIIAHSSLQVLGSRDPPNTASQVAGLQEHITMSG
uniref:MENTAL domain-containing protein n=1 Tax=Saimiri boliviensis boliviensis TaxID=39432 RepID=A0A2K6UNZ3_SAIBB